MNGNSQRDGLSQTMQALRSQAVSAIAAARLAWQKICGRHYCPLCDRKVGAFKALPKWYFEQWAFHGFDFWRFPPETLSITHYSCPICRASDRERLYAIFLRDRLASAPPDFRLIDFAPAEALRNWIRRNYSIEYRTADLYMNDVDDRIDLTEMPIYPTASVDAFLCSHMLEHIREDSKALSELFRILKPGGWGILMVPIALGLPEVLEDPKCGAIESDRWRFFGQGDHLRIYNHDGFRRRATNAGFVVKSIPATHFGRKLAKQCGFTPTSTLHIVEKPTAS